LFTILQIIPYKRKRRPAYKCAAVIFSCTDIPFY
jgi:hypothetical protein